MANRYGNGDNVERFSSSASRWQQGLGQYEEMLRKEQAISDAARTTAGFESQSARAATQAARARAESADLAERQAIASERSAKAAQLEADAITRTARAREQAAPLTSATGRRPADVVRGSVDPYLNQAYGLVSASGEIPTQYALRQQLPIGSYRARDIVQALGAGAAPAGATPANVRQAQVAQVRAEQELTAATNQLRGIRRRASATDAEVGEAVAARELAQANVQAAKQRVQQAAEDAAAHQQYIASLKQETVAQERAAVAQGGPGNALIPHPQLFGKQVFAESIPPWAVARYGATQPPIQENNNYATGATGVTREAANIAATGQAATGASTAMREFTERELAVAQATNRAAVIQRLYSDEMHRHGALTAEFIQATARGEVTLREFGNEMLVTIGKFAGWTAAASAVYGAFKVISDIRTGAVGAQSAVEGLTRFIPTLDKGRAYGGILDTSRNLNVGVQDVGNVAGVFARRYNNPQTGLTDTLTATRTALLAYKLDQISTADSTRFLMAITQEWQISAQRLPGIFDQISAAQRRYGARVSETLPALARSSSAVKNAGGDLNQLIGLLALAQVRTGQTGNVVGTAFLRSASNFFRNPNNAKIEQSYGLNPQEGFTQFLIDAVKRAQTLQGPDRAALAKAIGGPQYGARIFQALLNAGPQQVQRFLGGTSPESTHGSANQELKDVLGQADQELQQMGNTLQRIGGYLASSGLLSFAGIALHGINDLLGALELLLRLFNELPQPLTQTLSILGEIAVTMRLLSRFGISQRLQQVPIAGAFVQPGARLRSQALADQNAVVESSRRQLESDSTNALALRRQQERVIGRAKPLYEDAQARLAAGVANPTDRAALQAYTIQLDRQVQAAGENAALAERDVEVSRGRLAEDERVLVEIKAANARNIEAVLAQQQVLVSPLRGTVKAGELPVPITGRQFLDQTDARGALVNNTPLAERTVARLDTAAAPYIAGTGLLGRSGQRIGTTAERMIEGTGRAITSVQRAGQSLSGLGTRMLAFGAALGPLDYALIGIPALLEVVDLMQKAGRDAGAALDSIQGLQNNPGSAQQARTNQRRAQAIADKQPGYFGKLAGEDPTHPTIIGAALGVGASFDRNVLGISNAQSPAEAARAQADAAQQSADNLQRIQQLQARDRQRNGPNAVVSNRFTQDILRDVNNSTNAAKARILSQGEINAALKKYQGEIQTSYASTGYKGSNADIGRMRNALNALSAQSKNIGDYAATLKTLDDKGLTAAISATASELQQFGPSTREGKKDLEDLRVAYTVATQTWGAAGDRPNLKLLAQARGAFLQAATSSAQAAVSDGLLFAQDEQDRNRAYDQARRLLVDHLTVVQRSSTTTQLRRGGGTVTTYGPGTRRPQDDAAAQTLREQQAQLRDQQYQDQEAGRQIRLADAQSRSADQVRNSALAIGEARRQVDAARRTYGGNSRQYEQALTALNQAQQQQSQAVLSHIQAEGALLAARAGSDPAAQARAAVAAARRALSYMQAHRNEFDPTAILQAQAALVQAETQRADQIRQDALDLTQLRGEIATARAHGDPVAQAQAAIRLANEERAKARNTKERLQATLDLINANNDLQDAINQREQDRFSYLESLTTDPVKQAGLEVQRAALALKNTKSGTDAWYQAQAQYHQALQNQQQARLQAQEGDIDFELQMEQITKDQAIQRYQSLLKMHNLTKQERRDILLKIHQLQAAEANDSNGFDLRVGNVKLPTVYDVRRAISEGRKGGDAGSAVNVSNRVNLQVNVSSGADVQGVFAELDRQLSTSVTGGMRNAGLTV